MHLAAFLQERDRLFAVGRVVIDEGDLLALELVESAFLLGDVLQDDVGRRPVGAEQREVPLEHRAVARFGASIPHCHQRDLVNWRLFGERKGHAGRERVHVSGSGRTLPLQTLVALHSAVGGVAELALLPYDLDAVDAASALVDQRVVVGDAVGNGHAVGRVGPSAVDQGRNELFVLRKRRRSGRRTAERRERDPDVSSNHRLFSVMGRTARAGPRAATPPRRRAAWLRIFVVWCSLPCDPSGWGSFMQWALYHASIARWQLKPY